VGALKKRVVPVNRSGATPLRLVDQFGNWLGTVAHPCLSLPDVDVHPPISRPQVTDLAGSLSPMSPALLVTLVSGPYPSRPASSFLPSLCFSPLYRHPLAACPVCADPEVVPSSPNPAPPPTASITLRVTAARPPDHMWLGAGGRAAGDRPRLARLLVGGGAGPVRSRGCTPNPVPHHT
jgi:hypothetical protein